MPKEAKMTMQSESADQKESMWDHVLRIWWTFPDVLVIANIDYQKTVVKSCMATVLNIVIERSVAPLW